MTEGIEIIINGRDNFSRAASAAASSLESLKRATAQNTDAVYYANGIMNKWTASQYKAAEAGGLLTDKARLLGSEVARGTMTIAQANRQYSQYEKQIKSSIWQSMSFNEKLNVMRERFAGVGMAMAKIAGAGAIVGLAGKQIYNFAREGARIEFVEQKFNRLAQAAGSTGEVFLQQLKTATRGTVSDFGLLEQGSNLLQLGLARNTEEAVRLSKVMTALGMDTGELTLALANQSKRRLDQLGLSLTKFNEIEARLKKSGMTKEEAFREAFLQTAEQTIETAGNMADTDYGAFLRLEAAVQNLVNEFKTGLPEMNFFGDTLLGTVEKVTMFLNGMRSLKRGETVLDWEAILGGEDVWVRQATDMEIAAKRGKKAADEFLKNNEKFLKDMRNRKSALSREERYTAMFQRGAAMTDFYSARYGIGAAEEAPAPEINYALLMTSGAAMTQINKAYAQSMDEINAALNEQIAKLQELEASGYAPLSQTIIDQKNAIRELYDASIAAEEAQKENINKTMSAILEQIGASEETQLEFARASGQISNDAFRQAEAMNAIAQAMAEGKLTAEQGVAAIQSFVENLSALDGMSVDAYINLYMNTFGGAHGNTAQTLAPLQNITNSPNINTGGAEIHAMASGGAVSGGFALTGDTATGLTPYSELVYMPHGGYVFNARQTRRILASGGVRPVRRPSGGWVAPLPMDDSPTLVSTALMGAYYNPKNDNVSEPPMVVSQTASIPSSPPPSTITAVQQEEIKQNRALQMTEDFSRSMKQTTELLKRLLEKTASENGIARAVVGQTSKYS
ncbi:MAG: hypothetical protein ACOY4M_08335 [Pseudomonadota bacterium]